MSDFDDAWIDDHLRSVPLPPELLARLGEVAKLGGSALDNRELDDALCDVALPPAMLDRLQTIGSLTDADLDDDTRHVPMPPAVVPRLRGAVRWRAVQSQLARLAIAASLAFVIGGSGWLLVGGLQSGVEPPLPRTDGPKIASSDKPRLPAPSISKAIPEPNPAPQVAKQLDSRLDSLPNRQQPPPAPLPPVENVVDVSPTPPAPDKIGALPDAVGLEPEPPLHVAEILGNSPVATQPELRVVRDAAPHGASGPRVKGYDLLFEFAHGEHPVVRPGKNAALLESRVPIWTDTMSYELACRTAEARLTLPAGQIRTEDFLAAMDYEFPAPNGAALGIRTAAGPSPLGSPGAGLVQIGVQAGKFNRGTDSGAHLTLAVDVSAAVANGRRWEAIRRALADLVEQLGPRDRLSIVLFNERPTLFVRQADRAEMRRVLPALESISPRGLANLGAALEMAAAISRQDPAVSRQDSAPAGQGAGAAKPSARLMLLTDGIGWIDPNLLPHTKQLLKETVAAGVAWEVVDVRPDQVADPRLEELAKIGSLEDGPSVRHAETCRAIARDLREALIGRRDVVARNVTMKVTFNPDAIETYRLIGHDPTTAGGLTSGPMEADLRGGETATALYEVELKPDGADNLATVEVMWQEPGSEDVHHRKQAISRLQFAPSWMETPLSVQLAALAAKTAEILRGSYFAPAGSRPLDQVAELADRANEALRSRESFRQLRSLIDAARPPRAPAR
jgi:Ca-activated chloride channel family protein